MNSNQYTIIFHHIPKTAGSTFLDILKRNYENIFQINGINSYLDVNYFKGLSSEAKNSFDLIMGHQAILLAKEVTKPIVLIAFFRDPVEQFVSSYFYIRRSGHNKHHENVRKLKSLSEYLNYTIDCNIVNPQARSLVVPHYELVDDDKTIEQSVIENFEKINFPCITEKFDQSISLLKEELLWKKQLCYKRLNVSERDSYHLSDTLIETFNTHYFLDKKLYAMASEVFESVSFSSDHTVGRFQ